MSRRSRKRNPDASANWLGKILIATGLALILLVGLAYISLMTFLRGDSFRKFLSAEVSQATNVTGEFSPFKWDGLAVETDAFTAHGENFVTALKAEGLHTEVGMGGIWRGIWEIRSSSLQRLELSVDASQSAVGPSAAVSQAKSKSLSKKPAWLPSEAALEGLEIKHMALNVQLEKGAATANDMAVKLRPAGPKNAYRAEIKGGTIRLPFMILPVLSLERLDLRFQDRQLFLTASDVRAWERGRIQAAGEWDMKTKRYALEGSASGITCEEVLSEDWSKRLQGNVSTTFTVENPSLAPTARGKLTIENGTLTALPVLDTLAAYADTRRFRVINLNEAHTSWVWRKGELVLSDLVIFSEGLIRLEGSLTIRGENLDGAFRMGLAPGTLATIPGAETDVFTPGERGLLWAPLRISGTLENPKEDLSDRLMMAAGLRIFDQIPESGEKVIKFTRSLIPENQSKTIDQGIKLLEENSDLLRDASGILGSILGGSSSPPESHVPPPAEEE